MDFGRREMGSNAARRAPDGCSGRLCAADSPVGPMWLRPEPRNARRREAQPPGYSSAEYRPDPAWLHGADGSPCSWTDRLASQTFRGFSLDGIPILVVHHDRRALQAFQKLGLEFPLRLPLLSFADQGAEIFA